MASSQPVSPRTRTRTRTTSQRSLQPGGPPPSLPLPALPPGPSRSASPQLPSLPPLPSLPVPSVPTLAPPNEYGTVSPASSRFSANSFATTTKGTASTRPSTAESDRRADQDHEPKPRLVRAKSVTSEGIDFDLVTPRLGPSMSTFSAQQQSTSPPDTPTADSALDTPRALAARAEAEAAACGCDAPASPGSPFSSGGEEDGDYDDEGERLLTEAGLGGLGVGLLRRESEAVFLARIANGGRAGAVPPVPFAGGDAADEGAGLARTTTPPGSPPAALPPKLTSAAAANVLRRRKEAQEKDAERERRATLRKSKKKEEFDRFVLPTPEAIEAASTCTLVGEGGVQVTFGQLLKQRQRKVVVVFLRHAWCGLCAQFVEALNRATTNLNHLSQAASISSRSSTSSGVAPYIPPLYILLISSGSATLIPTYRARLDCPFPLYMDRTRRLYKALGMNKKTWDMGKDDEKGSYIVKSNLGNIVSSTKAGIAMPHYPGSQTQLGGEFVFEANPTTGAIECCYAARMHTTRAHSEIKDLFAAAGVQLSEEDAMSVYGGK